MSTEVFSKKGYLRRAHVATDYALKFYPRVQSLFDDWMVTEFDSDLGVILVQSKAG